MGVSVTVERHYCHEPLVRGDNRFLIAQTIAFSERSNPLFLARPEWLRVAVCLSAYLMAPGYALIALTAILDRWARWQLPVLLFLGYKINGLVYVHTMEFLSDTPPTDILPYIAVEIPYILSIALVIRKVVAVNRRGRGGAKQFGHKDH